MEEVSVILRPNPKFARGEFLYQNLARTAEDAAVAARSHSLHSTLDEIQEPADAEFWRLDKWRERLATLASDPDLVHTVYYRHPDAIDQIASHLVRSDEELLAARKARGQPQTPWAFWQQSARCNDGR